MLPFSRLIVIVCWLLIGSPTSAALAQDAGVASGDASGVGLDQAELQRLAAEAASNREQPPAPEPNAGLQSSLNFLALLIEGGALMIPIAIMSLLVVAIAFERLFALRRSRLFPRGLRKEIRRGVDSGEDFSPPALFQSSLKYPSVAAKILKDTLEKTGRPIPEIESTIAESTQREADAMYGNVRWLTLAAAVTPLIGLLGTVWGMIIAFYNTTQLGSGTNKAEYLAEGIYVALVTTLGGLAVAIPAAIFAHYFEGRITSMLAKIDAEIRKLMPRLESLEGRTRYEVTGQELLQCGPLPPPRDRPPTAATNPRMPQSRPAVSRP